ncbi:MAG: TonB family protein [Candidatus Cloacimonetes bacterium]|nr:TonB family protein [Candidatus Cloacimonadota bacterium]
MKKTLVIIIIGIFLILSQVSAADILPEFTLEDINGDLVSSEELLTKKAVIIDFWAKWCNPCKKALPHLNDLQKKYDDLLNVVCITIDKPRDKDKAKSFVKSKGYEFITLFDAKKSVSQLLNVNTIPRTYIINNDGEFVYTHEGYTQGDEYELETELRKIMFKDITIAQLEEMYPSEERMEPTTWVGPDYPAEAHEANIIADVILDLEILEDGAVGELCVVSINEDASYGFEDAAMNAVQQWVFEPVLIGEEPMKTRLLYPIRFRIEKYER